LSQENSLKGEKMDEKENCGSIYTEEVFSRVRENKT
jgi:hypothetical protein